MNEWLDEFVELIFPRECGGCGEPGVHLCWSCRRVLTRPLHRVTTREEVGCPVWTQNQWRGVARRLVVGVKERNRGDLYPYLGAALFGAVERLILLGDVPDDIVVVPAPTTKAAARSRGGDHMTAICRASGLPYCRLLGYNTSLVDAAGLGVATRRERLLEAVAVKGIPPANVLLVDDVVTTGSTLAASHAAVIDASDPAAPTRVWGAFTFCAA